MTLAEVLQAASNAAAQNVSGPVDLLTLLLQKGGVPVPNNAVGSTQWMRENGLYRDVDDTASRLTGETMGIIGPIAAAAKAPQIARGLLAAGENAAAPGVLSRGMSGAQRGAFDVDAVKLALQARKNQLMAEADDWAARKYKPNNRTVTFVGDGPGPEAMRIGSINENRRVKNITQRDAQIKEIDAVLDTLDRNPQRMFVAYDKALSDAKQMAALNQQKDYVPYLEQYLDKAVTGNEGAAYGPGSLGGAIRNAIESALTTKQAPAANTLRPDDDYLSVLFGGGQ
jgi:hypothetical protein